MNLCFMININKNSLFIINPQKFDVILLLFFVINEARHLIRKKKKIEVVRILRNLFSFSIEEILYRYFFSFNLLPLQSTGDEK